MKIAISAESTIDCPKALLEEYGIKTVPFTVILDDKEALDGEITPAEIFQFVKEKNILPKTSAVNKFQFETHFSELLKDNDAIIHFSLSSDMSSAYQNAKEVADKCSNIFVVDSRSLSTGIALLAIKASELAKEGKTAEEIYETCMALRDKVSASFILDKLNYLYKGGRCNSLAYFGASLFSIKPQIVVDGGKMRVGKKFVGKFDKLIGKYCQETLSKAPAYDTSHAFVTYTTATEEAVNTAKESLEKAGFKNIHITNAGGTISSHCGPNTLGILFITA
ncbi:MAG: DegV family protein [Clostridia bacterium]|nr:DegV family protein [Clostridia bacterium]